MSSEVATLHPNTAQVCALMEALGLPDTSALPDLKALGIDSLVELVYMLEAHSMRDASEAIALALAPTLQTIKEARGLIQAAIIENGGKAYPHDTFNVNLEQTERREKRIDVLRTLQGKLPDDLFRKSVFIKSMDVKTVDPTMLEPVIAAGGKPEWDADLVKLNKHARDFGPESEIGKIIAEGAPSVTVGSPRLVITPRESALRSLA